MASEEYRGKTRKIRFLGTKRHMKRGLSFFKSGDYRRAIEQFELILLHDKECVRAYNNLGYVHQKMAEYEKALEVWNRGLEIDGSYRRIRKNIETLKRRLERMEQASSSTPIGIEDFEVEIDWLSENAELIEVRESRFFETFLIEDSDTRMALKTLRRKPLAADPAALGAFERACSGWLNLDAGKYVVSARSIEKIAGKPFLAVEYAPEGSLRDLLEKGWVVALPKHASGAGGAEPLSLLQMLEFALHICIGLHSIHAGTGAAHGDIRPENMLLYKAPADGDEDGAGEEVSRFLLKITNVGLWATFEEGVSCTPEGGLLPELASEGLVRTRSGFITPSLPWCAPELIESGDSPDILSDIYSFGVVLYEMITGMLPFSGSTPEDILHNIRQERPEHPSVINPRIPQPVGNIAMRCLEEKPEARYDNPLRIGEAILKYLTAAHSALLELSELCKSYRKISKIQFEDVESGENVMIVGGTEFSSEIGQVWEIAKHNAEKNKDAELSRRIKYIEQTLSPPGLSIGELYPTAASVADALTSSSHEKYREDLVGKDDEEGDMGLSGKDAPKEFLLEVTLEPSEAPPKDPAEAVPASPIEVFGSQIAEKYSSLLIVGDTEQASRLLGRAVKLRAEALLLQAPDGPSLLSAFDEVSGSEGFGHWLEPIFEELPQICECPGVRDFLESGAETKEDVAAALTGLIFLMSGRFAEAQETLNVIPDSRYLQALNLYIWAMSKFRSPAMERIRRNSLKSAAGLLKDSILAHGKAAGQSTLVFSSHPGAVLVDSYFLRGLVFELLEEHRHAIANFRQCKKEVHSNDKLYPNVRPWADLVQGKSLCELGMPSEGFLRWRRTLMRELRPPFFSFLELGNCRPRALIAGHVLESCEDALSRYVDSSDLWCVKAKLLNSLGRQTEALDCVSRALEIEAGMRSAYCVKMESLLLDQKSSEALDALDECIHRKPEEPLLMLRRAEILCILDDGGQALHELKKAIGYGLEIAELKASIKSKRLSLLRQFEEFMGISRYLEQT